MYKDRLVVRGVKCIEGFDYFETLAPVYNIGSIRLVVSYDYHTPVLNFAIRH